jgi:hypothetical protein
VCGWWWADEFGLQLAEMAMSYYEREPRGGAATSYQETAQCAAVVAGATASARPGTPLSEVAASWPAAASPVQSVPDRFWTWTAADGSGQVQPVLHAFGGTEEGLTALAVADGPARWNALDPVVRLGQSRHRQKGCPAGSRNTRKDVPGWCSCLVAPRSTTAASAASRSSTITSRCIC